MKVISSKILYIFSVIILFFLLLLPSYILSGKIVETEGNNTIEYCEKTNQFITHCGEDEIYGLTLIFSVTGSLLLPLILTRLFKIKITSKSV